MRRHPPDEIFQSDIELEGSTACNVSRAGIEAAGVGRKCMHVGCVYLANQLPFLAGHVRRRSNEQRGWSTGSCARSQRCVSRVKDEETGAGTKRRDATWRLRRLGGLVRAGRGAGCGKSAEKRVPKRKSEKGRVLGYKEQWGVKNSGAVELYTGTSSSRT